MDSYQAYHRCSNDDFVSGHGVDQWTCSRENGILEIILCIVKNVLILLVR